MGELNLENICCDPQSFTKLKTLTNFKREQNILIYSGTQGNTHSQKEYIFEESDNSNIVEEKQIQHSSYSLTHGL
jgi:predicted adenine nucleotide alpha hydrolase (AANH) superfamily ATPase